MASRQTLVLRGILRIEESSYGSCKFMFSFILGDFFLECLSLATLPLLLRTILLISPSDIVWPKFFYYLSFSS